MPKTDCFSEPNLQFGLFSSSYIIAPPFPWSLSLKFLKLSLTGCLSHLSSPVSSNSQSYIHNFLCSWCLLCYLVNGIHLSNQLALPLGSLILKHVVDHFILLKLAVVFFTYIFLSFLGSNYSFVSSPIFFFLSLTQGPKVIHSFYLIFILHQTLFNAVDRAVGEISHNPFRDCTLRKTLHISQLLVC